MKKIIAISILSFFSSCLALADTHQTGKITRIVVEGNQFVSIWLENQPTNSECPSDGRWVIDLANDTVPNQKYSAILAAASSRQTVGLHFLSSQGCGGFGAKKVYYIDLSY